MAYLGVAHDVTERRRVQQALTDALAKEEKAVERLHELDRTKSEFVATVSHELRTPTTSIVGCTERLQDGLAGELTPAQLSLVDTIGRNSERLITLAGDLVTLSRVDAGDFERETCELDLREVEPQLSDTHVRSPEASDGRTGESEPGPVRMARAEAVSPRAGGTRSRGGTAHRGDTEHPQVETLARTISEEQRAEILQMQRWLSTW